MTVLGLREASLLYVEGNSMKLLGSRDARIFKFGSEPEEYKAGSDLSFLLQKSTNIKNNYYETAN